MRKDEQMVLDFECRDLTIDRLLHPTSNQDIHCPHIKWMGEDLVHCPGIGEWKCLLQRFEYGDQYGVAHNIDYKACNSPSHKSCQYFLAQESNKK